MAAQNETVDLNQTITDFAIAFEKSLGTEKTFLLLKNLTNFANQCPETIEELDELVKNNPQVFGDLLTPKGVQEAKELIGQVQTYMPLLSAFGG